MSRKMSMIVVDSVSPQTQGPFVSFVLERELIPHHHVPESVSTDNWLLQPRCIQPTVWYTGPVSECYKKKNNPKNLNTKTYTNCSDTQKMCLSTIFHITRLLCFRSAIHSVQPIELNFTDSPTDGSAGNTIQISMDCITMHEPDETLTVST